MASSPSHIRQLATEFRDLKANLKRLEGGSDDWEAVVEPMHARLMELSHLIISGRAYSNRDLALKAGVMLDWLDPQVVDVPTLLAASLCRDIILLFPPEDF